jgi:hypothetical protein
MGVLIERQKALYFVAVIIWLATWFAFAAVMVTRSNLLAMG